MSDEEFNARVVALLGLMVAGAAWIVVEIMYFGVVV